MCCTSIPGLTSASQKRKSGGFRIGDARLSDRPLRGQADRGEIPQWIALRLADEAGGDEGRVILRRERFGTAEGWRRLLLDLRGFG
jgi:hypothetical protein